MSDKICSRYFPSVIKKSHKKLSSYIFLSRKVFIFTWLLTLFDFAILFILLKCLLWDSVHLGTSGKFYFLPLLDALILFYTILNFYQLNWFIWPLLSPLRCAHCLGETKIPFYSFSAFLFESSFVAMSLFRRKKKFFVLFVSLFPFLQ